MLYGESDTIGKERAEAVLERWVRPAIRGHGGDVSVADVTMEGDVIVEFSGACAACPLRAVTFVTAVERAFDGVPGVRSVRCESVRVSRFALRRMRELMISAGGVQGARETQ